MTAIPVDITREIRDGRQAAGTLLTGDAPTLLEAMCAERAGTVKLIYMDPPYLTGQLFHMRVRVGEKDWLRGAGSLNVPTYRDSSDRAAYLAMMRRVLEASKTLLREDGLIFVHVDYRAHPYLRLMGDEIFGEQNFLNEIIWAYRTGGRSLRHFSRKHDVILLYAKGPEYGLYMDAIMEKPAAPPDNHMRRHVDPDGRVYRSIRSGGRVYTYYDDQPVAPSDVWSSISHLQQKDPERTGFDTQKPLALLDRIVRCGARPGDLVLDPFAGSCTTLAAAAHRGCKFIGVDACPLAQNIARRRLQDAALTIESPARGETPAIDCRVNGGVGFYHIEPRLLSGVGADLPDADDPLDLLDGWSAGYLREDGYHVMAESLRSRRHPALTAPLDVPMFSGDLCLGLYDILGRSHYYRLEP